MDKHHVRKPLRRFPREAQCVEGKETEHITLLASCLRQMAKHHKSRLEMGRTLIQLKRTVRHGEWEAFYEAKFGKGHVTLGTAQRYMKLARRDAEAKNGVAPFLKPGGSRGGAIGQAIRDANEQAKADQGARRRKEKVFLDSMFRKLTAELLNLPSWPTASHEILDLFKHVRNKFGIVHEVTLASENADKEVHLETAAD